MISEFFLLIIQSMFLQLMNPSSMILSKIVNSITVSASDYEITRLDRNCNGDGAFIVKLLLTL